MLSKWASNLWTSYARVCRCPYSSVILALERQREGEGVDLASHQRDSDYQPWGEYGRRPPRRASRALRRDNVCGRQETMPKLPHEIAARRPRAGEKANPNDTRVATVQDKMEKGMTKLPKDSDSGVF